MVSSAVSTFEELLVDLFVAAFAFLLDKRTIGHHVGLRADNAFYLETTTIRSVSPTEAFAATRDP